MRLSIIHFADLGSSATCKFLGLYFSVSYFRPQDVTPLSISGSDAVLVDFSDATDEALQELRKRWLSASPFQIIALVHQSDDKQMAAAKDFCADEILSHADGLSSIVTAIRHAGAPARDLISLFNRKRASEGN
jgi:DNA-binding NarL/FixJ family response regulator